MSSESNTPQTQNKETQALPGAAAPSPTSPAPAPSTKPGKTSAGHVSMKGRTTTISGGPIPRTYEPVSWLPILKPTVEKELKQQVRKFLLTLNLPFQENVQLLDKTKFEACDFWFPDVKLAIDVNDFRHHNQSNPIKNRHLVGKANYHKEKIMAAEAADFKLIMLWQNWLQDAQQWKVMQNIIHHTLGMHTDKRIFARKCVVKKVDRNDPGVKKFLQENALFGVRGGTHAYALFDKKDDEMLMVIVNRLKKDGETLLCERMCSKSGVFVVGGASKLLKAVEQAENYKTFHFFTVYDYAIGKGLEKAGFTPGKVQTVLMQYQVAEDYADSRGRGTYAEFVDNISTGKEARVFMAGTKMYTKENPNWKPPVVVNQAGEEAAESENVDDAVE